MDSNETTIKSDWFGNQCCWESCVYAASNSPHGNLSPAGDGSSDETAYRAVAGSAATEELLGAFVKSTGWEMRLLPAKSRPNCAALGGRLGSVCALIVQNPRAAATCNCFRAQLLARVRRSRGPVRLKCWAGLTEIAVPVLADGHHVATLVGCRAFECQPTHWHFTQLVHRLGHGMRETFTRRLQAAYGRVPIIPAATQRAHLLLLQMLAQQLGEMVRCALLTNFKHDPVCIRRARQFVEEHLIEPLTVGSVAARACLCPQQFSKRFKQVTGLTFMHYVILRRIERAKELLLDPQRKLISVAFDAGFQSLPTFYRVFHKNTGQAPSQYRASLAKV